MKEKIILGFLIFALLVNTVNAQEIDSVILANDLNYPDALVAGVAGNHIGAPVLLTGKSEIPDETMSEIQNLSVQTIYIVGGPEAISEDVENQLNQSYEVVRVWGLTRFGTASEVAKYFWSDGSGKAVLVLDVLTEIPNQEAAELVSLAKDLAISEDSPLLLTPGGFLPADVSDALKELGVKNVTLVGNLSSLVPELESEGINVSEQITGNLTYIGKKIRERVREKLTERPLVVVAVGNWSDTIKVPYRPNGVSRLIRNESQIDDLISEIQEHNYTRIMIVGKPELAEIIYNRLTEAGISVELISGNPVKVAARVVQKVKEKIKTLRHLYQLKIDRIKERLKLRAENITQACERYYELVNHTLEKLNLTEKRAGLLSYVETMKNNCIQAIENEEYIKAFTYKEKLRHKIWGIIWTHKERLPENVQEKIDSEIESKQKISQTIQAKINNLQLIRQRIKQAASANNCLQELRKVNQLRNAGEFEKAREQLQIARMVCEQASTITTEPSQETEQNESRQEGQQPPTPSTIECEGTNPATTTIKTTVKALFVTKEGSSELKVEMSGTSGNVLIDLGEPYDEPSGVKWISYTVHIMEEDCSTEISSHELKFEKDDQIKSASFTVPALGCYCLKMTNDDFKIDFSGATTKINDGAGLILKFKAS